MANGEWLDADWFVLTRLKFLLQGTIGHIVDDVVGARTQRNKIAVILAGVTWVSRWSRAASRAWLTAGGSSNGGSCQHGHQEGFHGQ
jgi:hypothetical protein